MAKSPDAFRTISEVAEWLGVQAHVLRFWESKFTQVKPVKRAGGRRYYRPADMLLLGGIKKLLHDEGMTIKGVQKVLREQGVAHVSDQSRSLDDLTMAQLDDEIAAPVKPDDPAKVLPFQSPADPAATDEKPAQSQPEDVTDAPASEPAPETEDAGSEAPADATAEPAIVDEAEPVSELPAFMHKPKPEDPAATRPVPRVVEVLDTPPESEIQVPPGVLAKVAALHNLPVEHLDAMRQAFAGLETLHARLSGSGKE